MEQTVYPAVKNGISATVYTQLSDIEEETNGLLTYDRIPKVDPAWIRKINERLTEGNIPDR